MVRSRKEQPSRTGPRLTERALVRDAGQVIFDRADEYVCSEALNKRLVSEHVLSAQVYGNYGIYRVRLETGPRGKLTPFCTCPAEMFFCKHAVALGRTWIEAPESFFDLKTLDTRLEGYSKADFISLIRQMAESCPVVLGVLGIEGFEEEEEDEFDEW